MTFGLCDSCKNQRIVVSGRGSRFSMCELGQKDPDWPKYPRVPVTECERYEWRTEADLPNPDQIS
jgi:hypothetical protein